MCDIYNAECEVCGAAINMHIGGYAFPRETVKVWCPSCAKKAKAPTPESVRVEDDVVWREEPNVWCGAYDWRVDKELDTVKKVIIYCTDPNGTDIHVN